VQLLYSYLEYDRWFHDYIRTANTEPSKPGGNIGLDTNSGNGLISLLLLDGQGFSGKTICQARPQAFENAYVLIGTKNY